MALRTRTLDEVLGSEVKRLREAHGVRQDSVSIRAQQYGLGWIQPTVAAIEGGRRSLSIGELGILPRILTEAGSFVSRVVDLIPATDEVVIVAPGLALPLRIVRALYGTQAEQEKAPRYALRETHHVAGEAERKAARALGVSPAVVLRAAVKRWGRGLGDERDVRIGARAQTLSPRSLQAVRGRVTHALVRELRLKKRRRRRAER